MSRLRASSCRLSPGTPFFSFFPFFSSIFFFFFGRRKWKTPAALRRRGEAEPRLVREQEDHPTQNDVLLLPVLLLSLFFFCFGRRKWRNPEQLRRRGEAEPEQLRRRIVKEEEDQPTQNDVVLGWFDFFLNQNTPKQRRFEVFYFFKSEHPKRCRFEVFYFYFFFKTTSPKRRRFGLPATKTTPF